MLLLPLLECLVGRSVSRTGLVISCSIPSFLWLASHSKDSSLSRLLLLPSDVIDIDEGLGNSLVTQSHPSVEVKYITTLSCTAKVRNECLPEFPF